MSTNNYFQTPQETSYGAITRANPNNLTNPLAHYCNCGGDTRTILTKSYLCQVRCTECSSFGVAHANRAVAIFNWNMSRLSQFPARLPVLPFTLSHKAAYDPFTLLRHAKTALSEVNDKTDIVHASAARYAVKWAQWFTTKHEFVTEKVMTEKMKTFNDKFIKSADSELSVLQKQYLAVFRKTHQRLNTITIYRNFLRLHCPDVLIKVESILEYPNRLVKAA